MSPKVSFGSDCDLTRPAFPPWNPTDEADCEKTMCPGSQTRPPSVYVINRPTRDWPRKISISTMLAFKYGWKMNVKSSVVSGLCDFWPHGEDDLLQEWYQKSETFCTASFWTCQPLNKVTRSCTRGVNKGTELWSRAYVILRTGLSYPTKSFPNVHLYKSWKNF